jgi:hypothetical protein
MEKKSTTQSENILTLLEEKEELQQKIRVCLDEMKSALLHEPTPLFRKFWEAKRTCLELFKEKLPPRVRTPLWGEYVELSDEARGVKKILDDNSSFTHEQLSLAIGAIEKELEGFESRLEEVSGLEIPLQVKVLHKNGSRYRQIQKELDLLNGYAARVNGMRKELIHIEMRMRSKNRLFERMSHLGNQIFPRRKALTQELSHLFLENVQSFVESPFSPHFSVKEEIKFFQNFAKSISIDSETFKKARELLSGAWDQVKEEEKKQQEKRAEERLVWQEHFEAAVEQVKILKADSREEKLSLKEVEEAERQILTELKEKKVGRDEIKQIQKQLQQILQPLEEKERGKRRKEEEARALELEKQKKAQQALLDQLEEILDQADILSLEALVGKWENLVKEKNTLSLTGIEQQMLEHRLGHLFDYIQEKKWWKMKEGQEEEFSSELHALLDERHKTRRKLKETLEEHRKGMGRSGMSFEQAMHYQELIANEKLRLDGMETMIEELEEILFDLEE